MPFPYSFPFTFGEPPALPSRTSQTVGDFGLTWIPASAAASLSVEDDDLALDDGLETAVLLSLFLDRRADKGDVLPAGETNRRGWWADEFATVTGDKIGSRLWLLARSKDTPSVLVRAQAYVVEALEWMKEDRLADAVAVSVTRADHSAGQSVIVFQISIDRPDTDPVTFRYNYNWTAQEFRRA